MEPTADHHTALQRHARALMDSYNTTLHKLKEKVTTTHTQWKWKIHIWIRLRFFRPTWFTWKAVVSEPEAWARAASLQV